jgi:hypothetical protein
LNKTLENLRSSKLNFSTGRLGGVTQGSEQSIERPLRILYYFESKIDPNVRERLLLEHRQVWDMILIIQNNELILNRYLPAVSALMLARTLGGEIFSWEEIIALLCSYSFFRRVFQCPLRV